MQHSGRLTLAAVLALTLPGAALAQSMPQTSPAPVATMAPMPAPSAGPMTPAPLPPTTTAPATTPTPAPSTGGGNGTPTGAKPQIKKIKSGSLTRLQLMYGVTHQLAEAKQLLKMKNVNFDNLRVYKMPTTLQSVLKVGDAETQAIVLAMLGDGIEIAQTTPSLPATNGNNSPIQYLRDVLANINVSNALNNLNVLNNSNVNVNVALSNVLNNNKISIGQVVGLYIGGGGIITTITK